jgi:hypothetical protein
MKPGEYTYEEACSLFDHHENTGFYPYGMTIEEYEAIMKEHGLTRDNEDFTDPAGGSGLHSHV